MSRRDKPWNKGLLVSAALLFSTASPLMALADTAPVPAGTSVNVPANDPGETLRSLFANTANNKTDTTPTVVPAGPSSEFATQKSEDFSAPSNPTSILSETAKNDKNIVPGFVPESNQVKPEMAKPVIPSLATNDAPLRVPVAASAPAVALPSLDLPAMGQPVMADGLPRVAAPDMTTLNEISNAKGRIQLLQLKVDEAKLQQELIKTNEGDKVTGAPEGDKMPNAPQTMFNSYNQPGFSSSQQQRPEEVLPVVSEITGAAGRLTAKIYSPEGGQVYAKTGDRLPGGYYVKKIDFQGVVLTNEDDMSKDWYIGTGGAGQAKKMNNGPQPEGIKPIPMQ